MRLWSCLSQLNGINSQKPWLLAGDFNVLAYPYESSKYDGTQRSNVDTKDFTECMHKAMVMCSMTQQGDDQGEQRQCNLLSF